MEGAESDGVTQFGCKPRSIHWYKFPPFKEQLALNLVA